jgi:1,4-dihydroxy-2-naphthoate octaprenyltransferase
MKSKLKAWIEIQELPKHIAVVSRIALGGVLAWWATGNFNWPVFLITLLAGFFLANGAFISNEYFDYETDRINRGRLGGEKQDITSTGGTRVLVEGLIQRRQALTASIIFFLLAMPLGIILQFHFKTGPLTIPLGVIGILIGWFYTAPPIKAAYRGWGEVFMMIAYGLLIITIYYTQAGWSWLPVAVASTQFAAVPAIKLLRSFPDAEADKQAGKRTLAVIFGQETMSKVYITLMLAAIILFIPTGVITRSPVALINLLPIFYIIKSLIPMLNGKWRTRSGIVQACRMGFMGVVWSPLTLTLTFLIDKLIHLA